MYDGSATHCCDAFDSQGGEATPGTIEQDNLTLPKPIWPRLASPHHMPIQTALKVKMDPAHCPP